MCCSNYDSHKFVISPNFGSSHSNNSQSVPKIIILLFKCWFIITYKSMPSLKNKILVVLLDSLALANTSGTVPASGIDCVLHVFYHHTLFIFLSLVLSILKYLVVHLENQERTRIKLQLFKIKISAITKQIVGTKSIRINFSRCHYDDLMPIS